MLRRSCLWLVVLVAGLVGGLVLPPADADESAPAAASKPAIKDDDYELISVLIDTLDQVERNYVKDITRRELIEAAIHGVLNKLDPYSNYIAPDELNRFRTSVESQFGGIGIQITPDHGHLKILSPLVGSPAYRAGLQAGDTITEIEGVTTNGLSIEQAVQKLKGEVDTQVSITVVHASGGEPKKVTLTREIIHLETVLGDMRLPDDKWDYFIDHDKHIGYIRLTAFSRETAGELRHALTDLKNLGLRGLVLDLRFNPGGLLNSAIEVSDLFITDGRIVSTEGRNSEPRAWEAHGPGTFDGFPMVVLVNRFSASSSEIVAACLQDHHRAVIIGERTWGKGSVQNVVELEGGRSALKLTTASYKRPSGKNIHRFPDSTEADEWGVMPDSGCEVRLSSHELRELIAYRRDRDILPAHPEKKQEQVAVGTNPPADEKKPAEETKPADEQKPAEDKQPNDADKPSADDSQRTSDEPRAAEEATPSDKPATETPADTKPKDENHPAESADDAPNEAGEDEDKAPAEFVDRQLQKAIEYLTAELAKENK